MKEKNKGTVGFLEKLGFASFSCSANIVFNFKSLYYLIFLTNVLEIPVLTAGTMMTIGTVWDVVNDPLIGVFAGNIHFRSGEKIRPYILYLTIPYALGVVLLFTDFGVSAKIAVALNMLISLSMRSPIRSAASSITAWADWPPETMETANRSTLTVLWAPASVRASVRSQSLRSSSFSAV